MAQPDLTMAPAFRRAAPKAKMNIYFAMLIISLVAMLAGCLALFLEIRRFGGFGAVSGSVASSAHQQAPTMTATLIASQRSPHSSAG
jgi:hypothetical protein